ncbi:MAG: hypothetical protein EBW87_01505 [Burkholderiaceae bacterium]|nr:hypothetical protein [Burkholderiaceae bacterium]
MATTTNFGWTTPDDTALVKDGASAIRTLGSSIDTSMAQLKGGTTGQILSKTSNTDMAFTWIANDQGDITEVQAGTGISIASGTGPIPVITNSFATAIDAKGDIVAGTGADTFARLAVGTNGQYLQADSTAATGLKWATVSASAISYSLLNAGGTATTSGSTVTISSLSGYNYLFVYFYGISTNSSGAQMTIRLNSDSTSKYTYAGLDVTKTPTITNAVTAVDGTTQFYFADQDNTAAGLITGWMTIDGANGTGIKKVRYQSAGNGTGGVYRIHDGMYSGTSVISSLSIITPNTFDAGTVYVYGAN